MRGREVEIEGAGSGDRVPPDYPHFEGVQNLNIMGKGMKMGCYVSP